MTAPLAYLATPYSRWRYGLYDAYVVASVLAARLIRTGRHVYCPIAESHSIAILGGIDPLDQVFWRDRNLVIMAKCDCLIVAHLDGWEQSQGIAWEVEQFFLWGRDIWDLDPETLDMVKRSRDPAEMRRAKSLCGND